MKSLFRLLMLALVALFSGAASTGPAPKYDYESVPGDPLGVRIYTLDNGLKVYISVNKEEPRLQTAIAVRAGSKNDPADNTGLAHYLEHMMFKGTSRIGSLNWEEEKKVLAQISERFEAHKFATSEDQKRAIYKEIDSLSQVAAQYVVPNEYDKLIASLGATGTNAFTSDERTVYINEIPSNELEKWIKIESERFKECVLRLFHTELETVYEEFNRGQDNDFSKVFKKLYEELFPTHPYGTQPTIGHGEHLKNPSMVRIHEYFERYYVPNNVAICLAGDVDPDQTMELIEKYFGDWKPRPVPPFMFNPEQPISGPKTATVMGPMRESVWLGYRLPAVGTKEHYYIELINSLLTNGQAGLIDINLVQKQKVLNASSFIDVQTDYGTFILNGTARQGQDLDSVKALLLEQIALIRDGKFDQWLIDAVVRNMKLNEMRQQEQNWTRCMNMVDAFILQRPWNERVHWYDNMEQVSKDQLVTFARQYLNDNYVCIYKRTGIDPNIHKVEKPKITAIDINRDNSSAFAQEMDAMSSPRISPVFIDYKTAISHDKLANDLPFSYIKNETNEIFSLYYILDMGSDNDKELAFAIGYLPYLGTSKYTAEQLRQEFFRLGLSFSVFSSRDRIYVYLTGLEESLEAGVKLFEHILADVVPDDKALKDRIDGIMKERSDTKLSKGAIHQGAMMNYGKYGPLNPTTNILTEEQMRALTPASLVQRLKELTQYKHEVFFYGQTPAADVMALLNKEHRVPATLRDYPPSVKYPELPMTENKVYYVNYDMVQTEILMISRGNKLDLDLLPAAYIFNEYFGAGLSSIVFQEIREAKALAYSAYCFFNSPGRPDESHYVQAYIGTQSDKLGQAVEALQALMSDMPEAKEQFEKARLGALKQIETNRITKSAIYWNWLSAKRMGIDYDIRKANYEVIGKMTLEDLRKFFDKNIKGHDYTYLAIGKRESVDLEALGKLGEVKELTLEEVFGY